MIVVKKLLRVFQNFIAAALADLLVPDRDRRDLSVQNNYRA